MPILAGEGLPAVAELLVRSGPLLKKILSSIGQHDFTSWQIPTQTSFTHQYDRKTMLKLRAEDEVLLVEKRDKLVGFILGLSELAEYPVPDRLIQAFWPLETWQSHIPMCDQGAPFQLVSFPSSVEQPGSPTLLSPLPSLLPCVIFFHLTF